MSSEVAAATTNTAAEKVETSAPAAAPAESKPAAEKAEEKTEEKEKSKSSSQAQANTSLYVGELDPNVNEAILFEIFNMVGTVSSIRVCRDAVTRRSLGYAYVNFLNAEDSERALEQLNYTPIRGRPCRIMWSQRDPGQRRAGQGNIFIKNLDEAIDNKALHDTFSAFGKILSCKVATNEHGSLGYGFVHYESKDAAEAAIKHVNGMLLNDKKVYVGHHISKKDRQAKIEEARAQFTNVYVKNLDPAVTQEEFEKLFTKYGTITSAALATDSDGKSRGFGFVNFAEHEQAAKAVEELNDTEFHGQKLFLGRAQKKAEREEELRKAYEAAKNEKLSKYQGVNLYIKNLPEDFDDERLQEEFAPFGTTTSAKVMRTPTGASRGFGFVCYSAPEEANKAVAEMNGKMIENRPLYVALAQRKDVRHQQLAAQMMQHNQLRLQQQQAAAAAAAQMYPGAPGMYYPGAPGQFPGGVRPQYAPGMMQGMPPMAGNPNGPYPPGQFPAGGMFPQGYRPPRPPRGAAPAGGNVNNAQGGQRGQNALAQQAVPAQPEQLTAAALANASPEEQKQMLGEAIYPKIAASQPQLAGKLTGMILELPVGELLHLLEDDEALTSKVDEALTVLREYESREGGQAESNATTDA
ncbi:Protein phosphatase PP2A regulatory subunit B [Malassezia pachydermatis]|uniref:Polyadenylate-binding protein n=1 Tax=Malassezia pachydermatis TaxID=77020 RepID=A0A0M8MRA3_9BASI|nr:polyadenylate-binding protein [Malassezia pachydermatis]KOS12744.1 polyadenylate-binding protein [Malassezia pachydermatis]